jgi:hypothetical protein
MGERVQVHRHETFPPVGLHHPKRMTLTGGFDERLDLTTISEVPMMLADGYPIAGMFWSMLVFFSWIIFIWLVITVYMDLFRRGDIGGWGKAGWVVFTLLLPFLGVLVYLIAEGRAMGDRGVAQAKKQQEGMDAYIRSVSATSHPNGADEIAKAHELLTSGAITNEEYEVMKRKVLVG